MEQVKQPHLAVVDGLIEPTAGYLDTAQLAFNAVSTLVNSSRFTERAYADTGLSHEDLTVLARLGCEMQAEAYALSAGQKPPKKHRIETARMNRIAQSLTGEVYLADLIQPEYSTRAWSLVDNTESRPTDNEELDALVHSVIDLYEAGPKTHDLGLLMGLGVARLTRYLQRPDIQALVQASLRFSREIKKEPSWAQAGHIVSNFMPIAGGVEAVDIILADSGIDGPTRAEMMRDLYLFSLVKRQFLSIQRTLEKTLNDSVSVSLFGAETLLSRLDLEVLSTAANARETMSEAEVMLLLEREAVAHERSRILVRKAKRIKDGILSISGAKLEDGSPRAPLHLVPTGLPLHEVIRDLESGQRAGQLATARSVEEGKRSDLSEVIETMRAKFLLPRNQVKRRPGNNQLTADLIRGMYINRDLNMDALTKIEAYEAASLLYALDDLLAANDEPVVLYELDNAASVEERLSRLLNVQLNGGSISVVYRWLESNCQVMVHSPNPVLQRVGSAVKQFQSMRQKLSV